MHFQTKKLALACIFASLYAVFSLVSLFPIIGALGRFITLASILAPIMGILLGPYVGATTASIGGFIGWAATQTGPFGFASFIPGGSAALTAGLLTSSKRQVSVVFYLLLLVPMAFFPIIGPAWLYPLYLWFQLIGLVVLISPASIFASKLIRNESSSLNKVASGVAVIALISTLTAQAAGSLMFELFFYPVYPQIEYWRTVQWLPLTFVYPVERGLIALLATIIGAPIIRAVRTYLIKTGGT